MRGGRGLQPVTPRDWSPPGGTPPRAGPAGRPSRGQPDGRARAGPSGRRGGGAAHFRGRGGRRGPGPAVLPAAGAFPGRGRRTRRCAPGRRQRRRFRANVGRFPGAGRFPGRGRRGRTWGVSGPHGGALPGRRACGGRGRRRGGVCPGGGPGAARRRITAFPGGVCRVCRDSVALGGSARRKSLPAQYKEARRTADAFLSNQSYSGPITLCFSSGCFFGGAE